MQMFAYPSLLLILPFALFSLASTADWPWTKTRYLARSNWSSLVVPHGDEQHSVWFIFHYLNYCGHCKRAEPGWEAIAQYALRWTKYIRIGAFDCASESTPPDDICEDEKYPQWRIYCPATNRTQLAFDAERLTDEKAAEDVLRWMIEKMNAIADQCYGSTWPVKSVIEPTSVEQLSEIVPNTIKRFQLFVSNDHLLYSLYVLNHSATAQTEPIYRLAENNSIAKDAGLFKAMRLDNGRISLQSLSSSSHMNTFSLESNEALKPFTLDKNIIAHVASVKGTNNAAPAPTVSDIDSAVVWMINRDLRRRLPTLTAKVKAWVNSLYTYYPGSVSMRQFLRDLNEFLGNQTTLSSKDYLHYVNATSTIKLPSLEFEHCNGSDSTKRGYPCTLWVLFHSMTVKQAILAERNALPSNATPSDVVVAIREFIGHFFQCEECATHFVNMTFNAENEIDTFRESVLYLWRSHNTVNARLRSDNYTTDPYWPKVPFPPARQCRSCVQRTDENGDAAEFNENDTYRFLKTFYSPNHSVAVGRPHFVLFGLVLLFHVFVFHE